MAPTTYRKAEYKELSGYNEVHFFGPHVALLMQMIFAITKFSL